MDYQFYYETVDRMQRLEVDGDYVQGWIGGIMGNPKREEQRISDAYEAGYRDGENADASNLDDWVDVGPTSG